MPDPNAEKTPEEEIASFISVGVKDGVTVFDNRDNDDVDNTDDTGDEGSYDNQTEDFDNAENDQDQTTDEEGDQGRHASDVSEAGDGEEGQRHLQGRDVLDEGSDNSDGVRKRRGKSSSAKVRIDELTKDKREAERRAEAAEAALAAAQASSDQTGDGGSSPAATTQTEIEVDLSDLEKPDPKKFKFGELDTEYVAALTDYNVEVSMRKREAKASANEAASAAETELRNNWDKNINPALSDETMPDFLDKVVHGAERGDYPLGETLGKELIASEHGAKIAYQLATDVDTAVKVSKMSDAAQLRWLGKQEARLDAAKPADREQPTPNRQSKAPAPPRRVPRGRQKPEQRASTMSFAEFEAMVAKGG